MDNLIKKTFSFSYQLAIGSAFVVIVVGTVLVAGEALPAGAIGLILGLLAMASFWAIITMGLGGNPGLDVFYVSRRRSTSLTTAVIGSQGVCPRGLIVGSRIELDSDGNLSRPLCRTALAAFDRLTVGNGQATEFRCECPLNDRQLTFEVRQSSAVG